MSCAGRDVLTTVRVPQLVAVPVDRRTLRSECPVFVDRLDGPFKLLSKRLREELLNGNVELLAEDNR